MTTEEFLEQYGNHKFFDNSSFSLTGIEIYDEGGDSFFRGIATSGSETAYFSFKLSPDDSSLNNAALTQASVRVEEHLGSFTKEKKKVKK